jgi:hypothetical protein
MGAHLRFRLGGSLLAAVVAVVAVAGATMLAPLPAAILLIAAGSVAGSLLGWPGALVGLGLLFLADGVPAMVAVGLAGLLPSAAMWAWRRWSARGRRIRAAAAAAERARLAQEMHDVLSRTLDADAPLPDLVAAISQEWSAKTGIGVILHSAGLDDAGDDGPAPQAGIELCWILREALRNVAAHARAETVAVTLGRDGDGITLEVRDDGAGFVVPDKHDSNRGIAGMQERARVGGGHLTVWSRPGGGTRITATVPAAMAVGAARPSWRVRLGAALAAAVLPLALVALLTAPGGHNTPLAAQETRLPFDPNATHGPATPAPASGASPGRTTATPSSGASRGPSARASGSATVPAAPPATSGTAVAEQRTCKVAYVKRSEWNPGFVADVTITNTGPAPVEGWSLWFEYTAGQKVTGYWNAVVAQTGTAVVVGPDGNHPVLAANTSLTFGVQGTWAGSNPAPSAFTLSGVRCG